MCQGGRRAPLDAFQRKLNGLRTTIERLAQLREAHRLRLLRFPEGVGAGHWQELEIKWVQLRFDARQIEVAGVELSREAWADIEEVVAELLGCYERSHPP